jgi:hypothetical protein
MDAYSALLKDGTRGNTHVTFNEEACAKAREYFGYFVLVSNTPLEVFEALANYRMRERIEELFQDEKGSVDGRRPRLWYPDALRGRMVRAVRRTMLQMLHHEENQSRQGNAVQDEEQKTKERLKLERGSRTG